MQMIVSFALFLTSLYAASNHSNDTSATALLGSWTWLSVLSLTERQRQNVGTIAGSATGSATGSVSAFGSAAWIPVASALGIGVNVSLPMAWIEYRVLQPHDTEFFFRRQFFLIIFSQKDKMLVQNRGLVSNSGPPNFR